MNIVAGFGFVYELVLLDKGQGLFGALGLLREGEGVLIVVESIEVVIAILKIWRPIVRMAPNAVFQHIIPNQTTPCLDKRGIGAY
ncbi:hypothetical protein SAMN04488109_0031 [Chryseolinea serpens]|uniref:Uncharacterized protein n=1 Tax=Chryseolinea serpens TaxID=947013 RepID=A0A1M5JFT3_9BACT|nr:hypothetical protein SAMN04488109_0031 [Chryseolinea serpens]